MTLIKQKMKELPDGSQGGGRFFVVWKQRAESVDKKGKLAMC